MEMTSPAKERRRGASPGARSASKKPSDASDASAAAADASSAAFNPIAQVQAAFAEASAVDDISAAALQVAASEPTEAAQAAFSSILGERKREDDDGNLPGDNEDADEEDDTPEEDTDAAARMLPGPEEEATTLVQCPPLEPCFDSWEDFHRAMEGYCAATHQPMRLRTSDSVKAVNQRAAKRNSLKQPIDESIGFVKKLYLCTHGVKTKPRGKGKRPRQHYRYMGCPAMIRASISEQIEPDGKNKYVVRVVAQINKHNHRLSEHLFKSYSETRVVIDDELIESAARAKAESGAAVAAAIVPSNVDQLPAVGVPPMLDDATLKANAIFQSQALDLMGASRAKIRVGWIGTGIMGASMCEHILAHGYEVTVYNRTLSKCVPLQQKGARVAQSPAEVAQLADIVFVMVGFPRDVKSVILDPQTGLLTRMKPGSIIVDMSTSKPALAKKIYNAAKLKGVSALDAPVSGGDIGARDASLSIMVGGDVDAVYVTMPFFSVLGKNVRHMGGPGAGQHTKMMNQILIATNMIGVVEGLLYAKKSGLDIEDTIRAVSAGAAGSWSVTNMGPRIAKRDFEPGFFVEHFVKDMGIALQEAEKMNLSLPGLALAHQLYIALKAQGHGRLGTQALTLALEELNGIYPVKTNNVEIV